MFTTHIDAEGHTVHTLTITMDVDDIAEASGLSKEFADTAIRDTLTHIEKMQDEELNASILALRK